MPTPDNILYEDNHIILVNKKAGELVQSDPSGDVPLEDSVKAYIKAKYNKPGAVFLGVVHRIDRPVSGVVLMAKTSKALVRLNQQLRDHGFRKIYWAIVEKLPEIPRGELRHHIYRDAGKNRSYAYDTAREGSKEAVLKYRVVRSSDRYHLVEVELITGRHHQIRAQLSRIGCPVKGDLKYGASRSNPDGGISLHARSLSFKHPVTGETVCVTAPVPAGDKLWEFMQSGE